MESSRCPVVYKKLVLMPTTWRKARRVVKEGKGIFVRDKVLGIYLKLKYNPIKEGDEPNKNQEVVLGMDPGTMFDGFTVVSKSDNRNFQYNHQLPIMGKLKGLMRTRIAYRRMRRSRLRHRPMRINFRTSRKISNTSNYYFQNRINMIHRIMNLYPISTISIEDVRFNHYLSSNGKSFSNTEIGKTRLYEYILRGLRIKLMKFTGDETSSLRRQIFDGVLDKSSDKGERSFRSHCIDSYTLGTMGLLIVENDIVSIVISYLSRSYNTSVRLLERSTNIVRRVLYKFRSKIKFNKEYYRYKAGGLKRRVDHFSKLRKLRFKLYNTKSNHGKIWRYSYTSVSRTSKKLISKYGGSTVLIGRSHCDYLGNPSKYWNGYEYSYYRVSIV